MKTPYQAPGVWETFGCNSMALVVGEGRHVVLSGQVAWDERRHVVGVGNMRAQAWQTFSNIQAFLTAVGGEMDDVISIVTYVPLRRTYGKSTRCAPSSSRRRTR